MQKSPGDVKSVFQFDVFEIHPLEGQLFKSGDRIKIQDLPFRLLVALLERPGEIVTREELRTRLWGGTIVDFDDGLHTAMRKLRRDILNDSATQPKFIETVYRRGYRFIAPVSTKNEPNDAGFQPGVVVNSESLGQKQIEPRRFRRYLWLVAGVVAIALVFIRTRLNQPESVFATQSEVVPITSYRGVQLSPALSPGGGKVAFIWSGESGDNLDLYVQNIDGAGRLRLTADPAPDRYPAWSPDERTIAFIRNRTLLSIPATGGPEQKITAASGFGLSWSPDSRAIAISDHESSGQSRAIFLVSPDTGERKQLTSPESTKQSDTWPAFSPDGRDLAFVRSATTTTDIYRVPVSGGNPVRLALAGRPLSGIAWSPDGKYLLLATGKHAPGLLAVSADARDSTNLGRVDIAGSDVYQPSLIARRDEVDLAYGHETLNSDILGLELGINSASPKSLVASIRPDQAPSFSPDGKSIAFCSARSGYEEIWISDADGSRPRQLTRFNSGLSSSPRWSPDGQFIVFDGTIDNNRDIYVVRSDGGPPRRMTQEKSSDGQPSWSHDGQWIYFMSDRSGSHQIWKMPAGNGKPVQITRHGGYQALESMEGQFVYYARQQRGRGIYRVPVDGGPETLVSDKAWQNLWALAGDGLYYLDIDETFLRSEGPRPAIVKRADLKTSKITTVATLKIDYPRGVPALAVRSDGRYLAWVSIEQRTSELMLIRNLQILSRHK